MNRIAAVLLSLMFFATLSVLSQTPGDNKPPALEPASRERPPVADTRPGEYWGKADGSLQAGLKLCDAYGDSLTVDLMVRNVGKVPLRVPGMTAQSFRFFPPLIVLVDGKQAKLKILMPGSGPAPYGGAPAEVVLAAGEVKTWHGTIDLSRWGATAKSKADIIFRTSYRPAEGEGEWEEATSSPLKLPLFYFKGDWSSPTANGIQTRLVVEDWPRGARAPKVRLELRRSDNKAPDPEYLPGRGEIRVTANHHHAVPTLGKWTVDLTFEKKPDENGAYCLAKLDLSQGLDPSLDLCAKEIATFHDDWLYSIEFKSETRIDVASGGSLPDCYVCLPRVTRHPPGYHVGMGHLLQGQYAEAVAAFDKAIEAQADFAPAYGDRARAYYALKKYPEAAADVSMCKKLGGTPDPALIYALTKFSGVTTAPATRPAQ